ncbi:MAG TPA: MiaB/RimO family radical SAM methylthiotransferase [Bacteroidia bacterium]|nr:MiaB/RimO family radical SAM methylthiotransferase [Bacteroidia bacterium]HNP99169.1 MiaB/RimO family radical SAM methylthiotransferase [Bacteroidia bacterium]
MESDNNRVIDESRQGEVLLMEKSPGFGKKLYLESYGCAMNFSDSEIIASIMSGIGFETTATTDDADVIFLNTCAIRDNAEQRIWARLKDFRQKKRKNPDLIVGVLGCMAERIKTELLEKEKLVDIVVGPDSYRDLPNLVKAAGSGQKAVNTLLSREETYAEISPVRLGSNGITAFISITRGCDNMCAFCVVPFTRGRERSRDPESIVKEAAELFDQGYREVTLLGQNVDSYLWWGGGPKKDLPDETAHAALSHSLPEEQQQQFTTFADLLDKVARVNTKLRIRFSTSNPRDMTDAVLHVMARHENIAKYIHLPIQSGSTMILDKMNRGYTRQQYMDRIESIRNILPGCSLSTDIITGYCGETEEDHAETLSIMEWSGYDYAYMFKYSERPGTLAARKYTDDIPEEIKSRRLSEIINMQSKLSLESNKKDLGKLVEVLVESTSKRSEDFLSGRSSQAKVVVFPRKHFKPGDYVNVRITDCTAGTLIGEAEMDSAADINS